MSRMKPSIALTIIGRSLRCNLPLLPFFLQRRRERRDKMVRERLSSALVRTARSFWRAHDVAHSDHPASDGFLRQIENGFFPRLFPGPRSRRLVNTAARDPSRHPWPARSWRHGTRNDYFREGRFLERAGDRERSR